MHLFWASATLALFIVACGGSPTSQAIPTSSCANAGATHNAYVVVQHLSGAAPQKCAGFTGDTVDGQALIVLSTTNPVYKASVLVAALTALATGVGLRRMRGVLIGVALIAAFAVLLNFVSAHLGTTVLFALPSQIPALGGPYTLEALAFGATGGLTIAAVILAAAPFSLLLASHEVMDALPTVLSRPAAAIPPSLNLVPAVA